MQIADILALIKTTLLRINLNKRSRVSSERIWSPWFWVVIYSPRKCVMAEWHWKVHRLSIIAWYEVGDFATREAFTLGHSDIKIFQQCDSPMRDTVMENYFGVADIELLELQPYKFLAARLFCATLVDGQGPRSLKDILYSEFCRSSGLR